MNRSQYLRALGVKEWKLRTVHSFSKAKVSSKNFPTICFVLSFGALKFCFSDVEQTVLKKQIWGDIAKFTVGNKQAGAIQIREFCLPQHEEENIHSINLHSGLVKTIFNETKSAIFFGLRWIEIFHEMAELDHMDKKKMGISDVLLLRSVEEFLKTPLQKRQVMMILDGWR